MFKSAKQVDNELKEQLSKFKREEKSKLKWWNTLDMDCQNLSKIYFSMFGSCEQRISQLYIIRNNQQFKKK